MGHALFMEVPVDDVSSKNELKPMPPLPCHAIVMSHALPQEAFKAFTKKLAQMASMFCYT